MKPFATGKLLYLEEVDDPFFSLKLMGDGYVIDLSEGEIRAPFDGEVSMVFPTGHALALVSKDNMEVLLHLGIDTIELEGRGFLTQVHEGQSVTCGQLLSIMDLEYIQKNGKSTVALCLFTSGEKITILKPHQLVTSSSEHFIEIRKEK